MIKKQILRVTNYYNLKYQERELSSLRSRQFIFFTYMTPEVTPFLADKSGRSLPFPGNGVAVWRSSAVRNCVQPLPTQASVESPGC